MEKQIADSTIQWNRLPTTEEQDAVSAQTHSNELLMAPLRKEVILRQAEVEQCSDAVRSQAKVLNLAQRRREATISLIDIILPFKETLEGENWLKFNHNPDDDIPSSNPSASTSPSNAETTDPIQKIGEKLYVHCTEALSAVYAILKRAEEECASAAEKHQSALVRLELAQASKTMISNIITSIERASRSEEKRLKQRIIWKVPPEVWSEIFSQVVAAETTSLDANLVMPTGWAYGSPVVALASVCQEWRRISINTKSLWSTITLSIQNPFSFSKSLVEIYVERMGASPCTLVVKVDARPLQTQGFSLTEIFIPIKRLHNLHFYVKPLAKSIVTAICKALPSPEQLTLQAIDPEEVPTVMLTDTIGDNMKQLSLLFSHISEPCTARLTSAIVLHSDLEEITHMHTWAPNCMEYIEKAVLRLEALEAPSSDDRITLPRLWYLEVHLYLLDRLFQVYHMPNLREIAIADVNSDRSEAFHSTFQQLGVETEVDKLIVCTIEQLEGAILLPYIALLPTVATLEIRGRSVQPMIAALQEHMQTRDDSDTAFRHLKHLVIADYSGDEMIIHEFMSSWRVPGAFGSQIQIELVNCSNMSLEILGEMRGANESIQQ